MLQAEKCARSARLTNDPRISGRASIITVKWQAEKLICPIRIDRVSIIAYLALGWIIVVGIGPMLSYLDARTALLIGVGGVLYSFGTGFHLWRALPFHNAIWHSFVLVAAGCHYAAILHGVVLVRS